MCPGVLIYVVNADMIMRNVWLTASTRMYAWCFEYDNTIYSKKISLSCNNVQAQFSIFLESMVQNDS